MKFKTKPTIIRTSEHDQQVLLVQWFKLTYPKLHLIAIPSGQWIAGSSAKGKFGLINKYKSEGWIPGVSDLFLCHSDGQHHGLWLEMKNVGKTESSLSPEQKKWMVDMTAAGYLAKWAAGFDRAKAIITDYILGHYRTF